MFLHVNEARKGYHLTWDSCVRQHTHQSKKSTNYLEVIMMICGTFCATSISFGVHRPIPEEWPAATNTQR